MVMILATIPGAAAGLDVAPGQVPYWLRRDAPLRLTLLGNADKRPLVGEFREGTGDSIWIRTRNTQRDLALPLAEVVRFEVSEEESPLTWSGAKFGLLAGALLGVVAGANEGREQGDTEARIVVDAIILGCLGMMAGAVVGHTVKADHWTVIWSR